MLAAFMDSADAASPAAPSILLVEDEPGLARVLEIHFTSAGYRFRHAINGTEALRLLMEQDYDVIVCDMVMPRLPGNMFYLAVQRVKPVLCERFIFITGHGESPGVREFLAPRTERVIAKPFNLEDLSTAVREVMQERGLAWRPLGIP